MPIRPCPRRTRCDRQSEIGGFAGRCPHFNTTAHSAPDLLGFFRDAVRPARATRANRSAQWHRSSPRKRGRPCPSFGDRHYWFQRVVYTGIEHRPPEPDRVKQGTFKQLAISILELRLRRRRLQTKCSFPALLGLSGHSIPASHVNPDGGRLLSLFGFKRDFQARYDCTIIPSKSQAAAPSIFRNTQPQP